jgi:hypothetical protein
VRFGDGTHGQAEVRDYIPHTRKEVYNVWAVLRLPLLLLRWKIKLRYRMQDIRELRKHPGLLWHWAAKWQWFAVLFLGALAAMSVPEYGLALVLFFLSGLSAASKIQHWAGSASKLWTRIIKSFGILVVTGLFILMFFTIIAMKGNGPWSHLPQGWGRMIAYVTARPDTTPLEVDLEIISKSRRPSVPVPLVSMPIPLASRANKIVLPSNGNAKPFPPSPEFPGFRERTQTDNIFVKLGGNDVHYSKQELSTRKIQLPSLTPATPLPIFLYVENGVLYADASLFGGPGNPSIEIIKNEFRINRPEMDRNFTDKALEVVRNGLVIFQMIHLNAQTVEINGVFPMANNQVLVMSRSIGVWQGHVEPNQPLDVIKPLFKYPSWQFQGVYAN